LGNFVKIFVVENKFEADLLSQALQKEGVPVMVRTFSDTAYDGLYIPQKGWAAIMVPEESQHIFPTMPKFASLQPEYWNNGILEWWGHGYILP